MKKKRIPEQLPLKTLMNNLFGKYIRPNSKLLSSNDYAFMVARFSISENRKIIKSLMEDNIVYTGYTTSNIRGCHNLMIFWRNKKEFIS